MSVTWREDLLVIDPSADKIAQAAAQAIADACAKRIPAGQLSDGSGAQAPPRTTARLSASRFVKTKQAKKALANVRVSADQNGIRGYDNGNLLSKRIKAIKQSGGKKKAEWIATLKLNPGKIADRVYAWLEREAAEGVEYIHAPRQGTPLGREVDEAMARALDEGVR